MAFDEMVDGNRGVRPSWRGLLGVLAGLGRETLTERAARLDRLAAEEGPPSLLPGAPETWRFDPIPLPLTQAEFSTLEAGLIQRARLLDAVLGDVYGEQRLLATGALPPALVYANTGVFASVSPHVEGPPPQGLLRYYAADVIRRPDGRGAWPRIEPIGRMAWRMRWRIADACRAWCRRCLRHSNCARWIVRGSLGGSAATPDAWRVGVAPADARPCRPGLVRPCPAGTRAVLRSGGGRRSHGAERGAVPEDSARAATDTRAAADIAGRLVDPLELAADGNGVPGLLAACAARVRIVNDPGTGLTETPHCRRFCRILCGYCSAKSCIYGVWIRCGWGMRRGMRTCCASRMPGRCGQRSMPGWRRPRWRISSGRRASRPRRGATWPPHGWSPSTTPCLGTEALEPRPVRVRMFLVSDGVNWQVMPGGVGCVLEATCAACTKDVWVQADEGVTFAGATAQKMERLEIRRTSGDLPSRVADNFFWLGRYLERLEGAARLLRISLARVARPASSQHELAELEVLTACLENAGLLNAETSGGLGPAALGQALRRIASSWGSIHALLGRVSRVMGLLRDRVTGEMQTVTARGLHELEETLSRINLKDEAQATDATTRAMSRVLTFAATVAGLAAENMVRGGGRLFLDLGRRVERAQAIADSIAGSLEFPGATDQAARLEHGLRLALELCNSTITYRSRYLAVVQPGAGARPRACG